MASHLESEDSWQSSAAQKYWGLLTSRIEQVSPFGQRLLFHLPCSPMAAYKWGLVGAPRDLGEFRAALLNRKTALGAEIGFHARDVFFNYLSDYGRTTESLGPQPSDPENQAHLVELAKLVSDIHLRSTPTDDPSQQIPVLADMLLRLLNAAEVADPVVDDLRRIAGKLQL